jgi:hypothetical protein
VFALPWRVWGERGLLGDGDDDSDAGFEKPDDAPAGLGRASATGGISVVGSVAIVHNPGEHDHCGVLGNTSGTRPDPSTSRAASPIDPARVLLPASPTSVHRFELGVNERTPLRAAEVAASTSRLGELIASSFYSGDYSLVFASHLCIAPGTVGDHMHPVTDFTRAGSPPAWFASQTQCAICLGDFERGDRVSMFCRKAVRSVLNCGMVYRFGSCLVGTCSIWKRSTHG